MPDGEKRAATGPPASIIGQRRVDQIQEAGYAIIPDSPDHFVTFDETGWFVEHSVACRMAGTLGTCEYNQAIRSVANDILDDDDLEGLTGRWRIVEVDEGLPSLERAERTTG